VFAPADRGRRHALRWAARHAARTGGCIQVLVDPGERQQQEHPAGTVGLLGRTLRDLLARVVDPLRSPDAGSVTRDLVGAVAGARLLVIPQSLPELLAVVEAVTEPVVAVPDHPLPPGDASVVLALAPWTGPEVIGAAFETAAQYGVALRVMQALDPERETGEAARTCRDDLAAWRLVRPQVTVDVEVVDRDPVEALHRRARGAQLLVMGRPARGRVRELVAPSPTSELLRTAACPVLVVPPPGPSRPTWSSHPGWGATH
jgi:nucleotide-binding universal stress UspA family protein